MDKKYIELVKLHNKLKNSLLASWHLFLEIDNIIYEINDKEKKYQCVKCGANMPLWTDDAGEPVCVKCEK